MRLNHSKRYKKLLEESIKDKNSIIDDAIKNVKKNCTSKFDESIDISCQLNLKHKKEEIILRTLVNLPNGNGKKIRIAVFCEEGKIKEAKDSGAEIAGFDTLAKDITDGKINFESKMKLLYKNKCKGD